MMKIREKMNRWAARAAAVTLSVIMSAAAASPAWAGDNNSDVGNEKNTVTATPEPGQEQEEQNKNKTYTITFTSGGKTLYSHKASSQDTWGPAGTYSVRSTYFKDGQAYKIVKLNGEPADANTPELQVGMANPKPLDSDVTAEYVPFDPDAVNSDSGKITCQCVSSEDHSTLLYSFTVDSSEVAAWPATLKVGNRTYSRTPEKDDNADGDASVQNAYYELTEDTSTAYTVEVRYVDEEDNIITTRSFYVNGKTHRFVAPKQFSVTSGDTVTYYTATDRTTIVHKVDDTARIYTIHYKKIDGEAGDSYTWYLLLYSSQTNSCIGVKQIKVEAGTAATFTPEQTITVDGKNYTINKAFNREFTHEYSDTNHTTYIYYDPEGYSNSSEVQTKTINIRYVNIADGNVLQSQTQEVTSEGDTTITFPDSFDQDGVHYLKVQGQASSIDYNFYSPKITYTVYYYDENNTQFRTAVITREQVEEITLNDGATVYTVIPGITRTVVNYTDNGVSTVLATEDSTGEQIAEASSGNSNANGDNTVSSTSGANGTAANGNGGASVNGNENTQDTTLDGVQADDIQTPQSNIWLDSEADNSSTVKTTALLIIGIAAIAACLIATIMLIRKKKSGNR